ncbi:uncharacterized protein DUF1924 [Thiocapsa rosea]|uniref:Uncharacterized protein DUF1924 n=2 Tax=Thiocapsa rosea TaxID=69360 RepID=A0A495V5Y6_9GAMM|nr:DUF1924 domain-containing protein [Thiocapsa rosea]RKT44015.1 uncharacterized protein DUF1924 [Thiocapsa rosea]
MKRDMKPILAILIIVSGAMALPIASLAGDATAGATGWTKEYPQTDGSPARSCVTCHNRDLTKPGRHAVTNKTIEPLAPSVNPQRLTDQAKVEKWLLRNCRWTLGRECTPEEKSDFISYIETQ